MKRLKRIQIIMMLLCVFAGCASGRGQEEAAGAGIPPGTEGREERAERTRSMTRPENVKTPAKDQPKTGKTVMAGSTKGTEEKPLRKFPATGSEEKPGPGEELQEKTETPIEGKTGGQTTASTAPKDNGPEPAAEAQTSPPAPVLATSKPEEHKHSYRETVVPPTCETGGYTRHECACGEAWEDGATQPLGHDDVQTGHADATTASEGYTEYTCSRCGAVRRETIPRIEQTGASASDAQQVCDEVNGYIRSHYSVTGNRGTYMGVTWVQDSSDVRGAVNSAIGMADVYAQYYSAKSFYCGYLDDGDGSYTIVLYWDTV